MEIESQEAGGTESGCGWLVHTRGKEPKAARGKKKGGDRGGQSFWCSARARGRVCSWRVRDEQCSRAGGRFDRLVVGEKGRQMDDQMGDGGTHQVRERCTDR